jgi:hypothetical protein
MLISHCNEEKPREKEEKEVNKERQKERKGRTDQEDRSKYTSR